MQSFSQKTDRLFAKPWLKIVPLTMLVFFFVFSTQVTTVLSGSAFSNLLLSGKVMARLKIQEWQRSHTPLPTPAPGPTQPTETGDAPPVTEVAPVLTEKQQKILAISQLEEAQVDSADPLLIGYPFQKPKEMDLIVIQSETFFDLPKYQDRLEKNGIVIHDDAISTHFHYYQDNGISGIIHVPTVGGGTVNTEYEALTGYGAKYFFRGTIIFTSILKHKTNAFPHFFKEVMENPVTIAIHNHNKEYWDRDRVYPLLGFDEYIDMTMFTKEEQEDLVGAWMSDKTIFDMTIRQLEAHPGKNIFLLPVTVQNHGPFLGWKSSIQIDNLSRDDGWQITHYASNLKYSDEQLKIFMDYIDAREKPTIVVFYGDHKPDPNYDMFKNSEYYNQNNRQNLFNTDYFIYFNAAINDPKLLALKGVHQDLTAPALNRYLQMLLGDSSPFSLFLYNHTKKPENYFDAECIAGAKDSAFRDISMDFINEWIPYSDFEMK